MEKSVGLPDRSVEMLKMPMSIMLLCCGLAEHSCGPLDCGQMPVGMFDLAAKNMPEMLPDRQ